MTEVLEIYNILSLHFKFHNSQISLIELMLLSFILSNNSLANSSKCIDNKVVNNSVILEAKPDEILAIFVDIF